MKTLLILSFLTLFGAMGVAEANPTTQNKEVPEVKSLHKTVNSLQKDLDKLKITIRDMEARFEKERKEFIKDNKESGNFNYRGNKIPKEAK